MHGSAKHRDCLMPAMLRSMRCARTIRLWRRDGGQVLAKLRDQVLGRHDVDGGHGTIGRNERDQLTKICGGGEKVIRKYRTVGNVRDMRYSVKLCETSGENETRTVCRPQFIYLLTEEVAQIPNVGWSIVTPKESVGATRLTGSRSGSSHQIAMYSSVMKCLPARSGVIVCRSAGSSLAFTMLISRVTFTIRWTTISTGIRWAVPIGVVVPMSASMIWCGVVGGLMVGGCRSGIGWWWIRRFRYIRSRIGSCWWFTISWCVVRGFAWCCSGGWARFRCSVCDQSWENRMCGGNVAYWCSAGVHSRCIVFALGDAL